MSMAYDVASRVAGLAVDEYPKATISILTLIAWIELAANTMRVDAAQHGFVWNPQTTMLVGESIAVCAITITALALLTLKSMDVEVRLDSSDQAYLEPTEQPGEMQDGPTV